MSKFKILRNRETLSSQEIAKQMNFNNFISGYSQSANFLMSIKSWLILGVGGVSAVIVALVLMQSPLKIISSTQPFIVPPIPQLNITPNNLIVSGTRDTVINYKSGTKLFIPANAFNYENNKPATGPFRISFREFHDQVDQLLSGIPMLYDSTGIKKQFESAGMFDIMAFENDVPVFIKEGKELIVDMPSKNLDNNFNVYYLDTIQKNWMYDKDNSENNILLIAGIDTMLHKKFQTGLESIVIPEIADPLYDNLVIDFNKEEFPELAFFDGIKFQFTDKKNNNRVGSEKTWEDVQILRQDHHHYLVTFTNKKLKQSFVTIPVLEKKDFDNSFAEYDKIRIKRISKFKNTTDSLNNLRSRYGSQYVRNKNANEGINNFIHKGEFLGALNEYCDRESFDLITKQGTLSRMILVRKFGIFNCDRTETLWVNISEISKKNRVAQKAHYYFENSNKELEVDAVYFIKKDFNGIYNLGRKELSKFPVNSAMEADILVLVTDKKEILYIKDDEFKTTDYSKPDISFIMHAVPNDLKNVIDVRKYFNL